MQTGWAIFWVLVALGFYRLRCSYGMAYGIIEVIAGTVAIILSEFPPYTVITANDISVVGSQALHILTLMGGIYIVVRGMDNINQNLPPRLRPAWQRIFGASRAS
jgi:hypothetical protein